MKSKGKNNILVPLAVLLLIIASIALTRRESSAWFSLQRSISTPSEIAMPAVLDIRGKDYSEIAYMNLSELNTAGGEGSVQFLFCVCGETQMGYVLELAHTTNVPFVYQIFPAQISAAAPDAGWIEYTAEETEATYYYNSEDELVMHYLNLDETAPLADPVALGAGNVYYQKVYIETDSVHANAMPLYKLSSVISSNQLESSFIDYYVIEVSWDESIQNKEVDMVYLMAQVATE